MKVISSPVQAQERRLDEIGQQLFAQPQSTQYALEQGYIAGKKLVKGGDVSPAIGQHELFIALHRRIRSRIGGTNQFRLKYVKKAPIAQPELVFDGEPGDELIRAIARALEPATSCDGPRLLLCEDIVAAPRVRNVQYDLR